MLIFVPRQQQDASAGKQTGPVRGNFISGHSQMPGHFYIIFLKTKPSGIPRCQM
jgi:hypothetical protein